MAKKKEHGLKKKTSEEGKSRQGKMGTHQDTGLRNAPLYVEMK